MIMNNTFFNRKLFIHKNFENKSYALDKENHSDNVIMPYGVIDGFNQGKHAWNHLKTTYPKEPIPTFYSFIIQLNSLNKLHNPQWKLPYSKENRNNLRQNNIVDDGKYR